MLTNDSAKLMRYLDGRMTAEEARVLSAELRASPEKRQALREMAFQATALADIARSRSLRTPPPPTVPPRRSWSILRWGLTAAAVVGLAVTFLVFRQHHDAPAIVTITEISGTASWSGADGRVRSALAAGDQLGAGTIETEDDMARVQLGFADGTQLTLAGNGELAIADDGQKRLRLKKGFLTAGVAPQPAGQPLLVETSTAKIEVLGTSFAVTTKPEETLLNVEEGRVRMRRLVDGREVEVPARHSAVASLDASAGLVAGRPAPPPQTWSVAFDPRPRGWIGDWKPADGPDVPARLRAQPYQAGRRNGIPVIHRGIRGSMERDLNPGGFVSLAADSVIRFRCRTERPSALQIFLSTHTPAGGFADNFEGKVPANAGTPEPGGWRRIEMPLSAMRALLNRYPHDRTGLQVHHVVVASFSAEVGLELADVAIGPPRLLDKAP